MDSSCIASWFIMNRCPILHLFQTNTSLFPLRALMKPAEGAPSALIPYKSTPCKKMKAWRPLLISRYCRETITGSKIRKESALFEDDTLHICKKSGRITSFLRIETKYNIEWNWSVIEIKQDLHLWERYGCFCCCWL